MSGKISNFSECNQSRIYFQMQLHSERTSQPNFSDGKLDFQMQAAPLGAQALSIFAFVHSRGNAFLHTFVCLWLSQSSLVTSEYCPTVIRVLDSDVRIYILFTYLVSFCSTWVS